MPGLRVLFLGGQPARRQGALHGVRQRQLRSVAPGYRAVIPFEQGAREIVAWHDEDPARQRIDAGLDALTGKLARAFRPAS
jgi:hypothetical protein